MILKGGGVQHVGFAGQHIRFVGPHGGLQVAGAHPRVHVPTTRASLPIVGSFHRMRHAVHRWACLRSHRTPECDRPPPPKLPTSMPNGLARVPILSAIRTTFRVRSCASSPNALAGSPNVRIGTPDSSVVMQNVLTHIRGVLDGRHICWSTHFCRWLSHTITPTPVPQAPPVPPGWEWNFRLCTCDGL